mmetsp:Transcript_22632/g.49429  ORF Transcript_22632/g.49429 Transcript_22632/m.49429 type:complete len:167 (+) Transcript_22632:73-573(+)|eukprot:CAMPEP_0168766310 /NCGR_PEP_ID=MMETSP0725-20121227/773_1 /TAXON_ID=265536 /ORGANISM="Amphiprora sp., Strain CCMP467" /LENGTH=166 /DNA_ID=CAMNT_0008815589 /DNA_START=12 /DNA_END=509 /DNA_ORIENTATION=-
MASNGVRFIPQLVPKLHRASRKKIHKHGLEALKATWKETPDGRFEGYWKSPVVSNRVANVLRKEAIREGTYGEFNYETLTGWDREWDIELEKSRTRGQGRHRTKAPRLTKRVRTREERAQKIEKAMEGMDERIEKFYEDRAKAKPEKNFEYHYKQMLKNKNAPTKW